MEEILTYNIFKNKEDVFIHVPVFDLVDPDFLLKDNDLYIFLYNYKKFFKIGNLKQFVVDSIVNKRAFLIEDLNFYKKNHSICLF